MRWLGGLLALIGALLAAPALAAEDAGRFLEYERVESTCMTGTTCST